MTTLAEVKGKNEQWFSKGNKKFFGDIGYKVLHGKTSKNPFLIQITNKWGISSKVFFIVKGLETDLKISDNNLGEFFSLEEAKDFLKGV